MTCIRQRFGLSVFRRFFERILDLCTKNGLVWGREVLVDASMVPGNADLDSLVPRLKDVVDDHLVELSGISPRRQPATMGTSWRNVGSPWIASLPRL